MGGLAAARRSAVERFDLALSEGRLFAEEHATRVASARNARGAGDLDTLVCDLPVRAGETAWDDGLRVRAIDHHRAAMSLGEALATGALSAEEYRRRLTKVAGTATYGPLKKHLDGVAGQEREHLFVTAADRERVGTRIEQAFAQDRLRADVHRALNRALGKVRRYRDLDRVTTNLADHLDRRKTAPEPEAVEEPEPVEEPERLSGKAAVVWEAPWDRPADVRAIGTWLVGSTLIRVRPDRITAYDVATGATVWTTPMEGRDRIHAMSRGTASNVGVIALGSADKASVMAIELFSGDRLWHRPVRRADSYAAERRDDGVDLATGTAAILDQTGFVGVAAHSGIRLWSHPAPTGFEPFAVAASGDDAVLLSARGEETAQLTMVDAVSGAVRFSTRLGQVHGTDGSGLHVGETTAVLSTTPLVVRTAADGEGVDALVSFDGWGRRRATILLTQPDHDLVTEGVNGTVGYPLTGRPQVFAVVGDTVIASAIAIGQREVTRLAAYSLADGGELWRADLPDRIEMWTVADERIVALTAERRIHALTPDTGRHIGAVEVDGLPPFYPLYGCVLRLAGGHYVVTSDSGSNRTRPVCVLGR